MESNPTASAVRHIVARSCQGAIRSVSGRCSPTFNRRCPGIAGPLLFGFLHEAVAIVSQWREPRGSKSPFPATTKRSPSRAVEVEACSVAAHGVRLHSDGRRYGTRIESFSIVGCNRLPGMSPGIDPQAHAAGA